MDYAFEVQNYHRALDYVETLIEDIRPIQLADMCDLQKLVGLEAVSIKQM
jgi:hypothetical protein